MPLHPRDKTNAYLVGLLAQTIRLAVIDLEYNKTEEALTLLRSALVSFEERIKGNEPLPTS